MNSDQVRTASALVSSFAIGIIILGSILTLTWGTQPVPTDSKDLGDAVFNFFGPTLIVLGVLLFAAMLGGVFIAQEERE